jgi:hypothetical protein
MGGSRSDLTTGIMANVGAPHAKKVYSTPKYYDPKKRDRAIYFPQQECDF